MKRVISLLLVFSCLAGAQTSIHIRSAALACESGKASMRDKDPAAAVGKFQKAIELEPTFSEAHEGLIEALLALNKPLEAATAMTKFLEIEPQHNRYRLLIGQILVANHDLPRALAQFSLVLKSDPFNSDALLGFAITAKQLGMEDRAAKAIELGRINHPKDMRFR